MTSFPDQHLRRYTLSEYLAFEEASDIKHEFHEGEVLAMSGSSPEHAMITANAIRVLGNALENSQCGVYSSDLKIYVRSVDRVFYPDASIVCGPLEFDPHDEKRRLVTNPRVIVEVLSPTTEGYDRGAKFRDYRILSTLDVYVLISQEQAMIETFVRQADATWVIGRTFTGLDAVAEIPGIGVQVKLGQIYARVAFQPRSPIWTDQEE
jgi:Uma2 family endonuclease